MMPWELVAWHVNPNASGGFDFGIDDSTFGPVTQMIEYMNNKVRETSSGMPAMSLSQKYSLVFSLCIYLSESQ